MKIRDLRWSNRGIMPLVIGLLIAIFVVPMRAVGESPSCKPDALPVELQNLLKKDFTAWRIQEVSNLRPRAKGRWEDEKGLECPGIVVGSFESTDATSYAVLLVPASDPDSAYRLLVFTPGSGASAKAS
ncbi:MAG: hypothetical protein WB421_04275 [Terriglobales bacterium]